LLLLLRERLSSRTDRRRRTARRHALLLGLAADVLDVVLVGDRRSGVHVLDLASLRAREGERSASSEAGEVTAGVRETDAP